MRHYRICPVCEACCGLEIRTEAGRITSVRGAEHDVFSHGYICPKGVAVKDLHDDPDRLRTPLIRRGNTFVEATWDEAFAEIAARLPAAQAAHGRDAVALSIGNPSAHKMGLLLYVPRLAKALDTKNIFTASTLDQMPKQLSCGLMFGHWLSIPVPDIDRTDLLVVLGANPMASNGSLWTVPDFRGRAKALRARGGRLVVIDPRRTETAAIADEHHFIRPGSDVFLLAAMVHALFGDGWVRPERLSPWLAGVDAVRDAVQPFAPEAVAARCGIPAPSIRALARQLAEAERACLYGRIGTCTQTYGSAASWLVDVINALTGHLDTEGGAMFPKAAAFARNTEGRPGQGAGIVTGRHRSRVSGAPEVFGELPMTLMAEEMETPGAGQVRALVTLASNPVLSAPNGDRIARALAGLDFMVSVDLYLNETTRHAHVILPGSSPLEDGHWDVPFPQLSVRNHARYSAPVLPRPAGHLPEWQILTKLAAIARGDGPDADPVALDDTLVRRDVERLAGERADAVLAEVSRWTGPERLLDLSLRAGPYGDGFGARPDGLTLQRVADATGGIDLGALQPRLPELLRTTSGRVELAPAPLLAELAKARAELHAPAPPMVIIGRREVRSNNSWMHNLQPLAKGPERCTLKLHPQDAARHGVVDGQRVRIVGPQGAAEAPVELDDALMPGVCSLPHGWGHDVPGTRMTVAAERPGANLNALLDDRLRDAPSGNAVLSGVSVTLEPAG
ncbi:molybdopterin-dependent oxidoreductase [Rubrivivax albus]|uniref:Molybdopterin oxidoreductase family protein n=1 Tax=Rubrivivax albus TaxID=2499835 RepID=A0A3S3S8Y9_9BURK|nr:molybdopterin-dependent oxidoreductase [Rubrivivax albus]RVT48563.1 molybdopterin oxidoreductase family protein [Rubrivivax albus]